MGFRERELPARTLRASSPKAAMYPAVMPDTATRMVALPNPKKSALSREIRGQSALKAGRMSGLEAPQVAAVRMPAGTDISAVDHIGRVKAQAGNDRKGMAGPGINRDPAPATAFAITHEIARGYWR